jgi:hypothetical protein
VINGLAVMPAGSVEAIVDACEALVGGGLVVKDNAVAAETEGETVVSEVVDDFVVEEKVVGLEADVGVTDKVVIAVVDSVKGRDDVVLVMKVTGVVKVTAVVVVVSVVDLVLVKFAATTMVAEVVGGVLDVVEELERHGRARSSQMLRRMCDWCCWVHRFSSSCTPRVEPKRPQLTSTSSD